MNKDLKVVYNCLVLNFLSFSSLLLAVISAIGYEIDNNLFLAFAALIFFILALYINHGVLSKKEKEAGLN